MIITWDEPKRLANLEKHGLDFADLTVDFFLGALVIPSRESRFLAIGWNDNVMIIAVVFRPLGSEALSIVSMRAASAIERRFYDER